VHLTNHCLQETRKEFGALEEGNEVFFDVFRRYLKEVEMPVEKAVCDMLGSDVGAGQ